jgi:DNA-binding NarL/FixJ family response regulator
MRQEREVADRRQDVPTVLVVHSSSAACAEGVAAFVDGRAGVVLVADELALLPDALDAASKGFAVLSSSVVEAARPVAVLTAGERALLSMVADGASNDEIAGELGCSLSSAKREVLRLCSNLGVAGRPALIGVARDLGF